MLIFSANILFCQTTIATGSILGLVTDPSGAVISGAEVSITNLASAQIIPATTNPSGAFNSGALTPGIYKILISARGFSSGEASVDVRVGNTATVNMRLQLGNEREVVDVQASATAVNTAQATVHLRRRITSK